MWNTFHSPDPVLHRAEHDLLEFEWRLPPFRPSAVSNDTVIVGPSLNSVSYASKAPVAMPTSGISHIGDNRRARRTNACGTVGGLAASLVASALAQAICGPPPPDWDPIEWQKNGKHLLLVVGRTARSGHQDLKLEAHDGAVADHTKMPYGRLTMAATTATDYVISARGTRRLQQRLEIDAQSA
jgi:hypothetical protein